MPRPIRYCPGGYIFHVLNRANSRNRIFNNRFQYNQFLEILLEAYLAFTVKILSYCIMPNHWHLLLQPTEDGELSRFVGWITNTHTRRYRTFNNSIGHGPLYQGRFKSFPVKNDRHFFLVKGISNAIHWLPIWFHHARSGLRPVLVKTFLTNSGLHCQKALDR